MAGSLQSFVPIAVDEQAAKVRASHVHWTETILESEASSSRRSWQPLDIVTYTSDPGQRVSLVGVLQQLSQGICALEKRVAVLEQPVATIDRKPSVSSELSSHDQGCENFENLSSMVQPFERSEGEENTGAVAGSGDLLDSGN